MFDKLKRFFQGEPTPIAEKIEDPVLGTLTWSKDDKAWISSTAHTGAEFVFLIYGTPEPCKASLAHAADILRRKDEFLAEVQAYVKSEAEEIARTFPQANDEIAGLRVESVCLGMGRPNDGMIYFASDQEDRLWRCDYIAGKPTGLGCDT